MTDNSLTPRISARVWAYYAFAIAATVAVLLACHALNRFAGNTLPYILLLPLLACFAWYCGTGPSVVALILALVGIAHWFVDPARAFRLPDVAQSIAFLFASSVVIVMAEARRKDHERVRQGQKELEHRVIERTAELDAANKGLRELSARLLQLQDDERRRIARELHDSVGQLLAGLIMNVSAARTDIERLAKTATILTDAEALAQEMSQEVRTISHLLHPPLLDEAGLTSALRWYTDGFAQRSKIEVVLDFPDDFRRLPREEEIAIFRVVQECLTNVHRHSGSSIAKIRVRQLNGQVLVEVRDKGNGITPEKLDEMTGAGTPGVGIRGMRERLRQLGGDLEINSNASGTAVTAWVPIIEASRATDALPVSEAPSTAPA